MRRAIFLSGGKKGKALVGESDRKICLAVLLEGERTET